MQIHYGKASVSSDWYVGSRTEINDNLPKKLKIIGYGLFLMRHKPNQIIVGIVTTIYVSR